MSIIKIDGKLVPLETLTKEEKAAAWDTMSQRISQSITDYVNRHPEQYDDVVAALEWAAEHAW